MEEVAETDPVAVFGSCRESEGAHRGESLDKPPRQPRLSMGEEPPRWVASEGALTLRDLSFSCVTRHQPGGVDRLTGPAGVSR
jgi:hypothetical protein